MHLLPEGTRKVEDTGKRVEDFISWPRKIACGMEREGGGYVRGSAANSRPNCLFASAALLLSTVPNTSAPRSPIAAILLSIFSKFS
jgi:hypothetical protein